MSVHSTHCCQKHGCKYGEVTCPVVLHLEGGIHCEICEYEDNDTDIILQRKLAEALRLSLTALRRGRPQIQGVLVQMEFDEAIKYADEALREFNGDTQER